MENAVAHIFMEWEKPYIIEKISKTGYRYLSLEKIPINVMIQNNPNSCSNFVCFGYCEDCGNYFECIWNNFKNRKNDNLKMICGSCSRKKTFTEKWRRNNSAAQKIAQNRPEVKQKMSESLKKMWATRDDVKEKVSNSLKKMYASEQGIRVKKFLSENSKRCWEMQKYQEKVTGFGFYHGTYLSKFGSLYFASSWELSYMMWCENNEYVLNLKRCEDKIEYKNKYNNESRYYPDFYVETRLGNYVVEIKGKRSDEELVELKRLAALKFYENKNITYLILYKNDLKILNICVDSRINKKTILTLAEQGKVINYGFGKKENNKQI